MFGKYFVYQTLDGDRITLLATVSRHIVEADSQHDIINTWHGHVFVVWREDLQVNGVPHIPLKGEHFFELDDLGGDITSFQVMSPPKGRVYDPIDAEHHQLAIYTKEVAL